MNMPSYGEEFHREAQNGITYRWFVEEDDTRVRGNASAVDPETDKRYEDKILERLDKGDVWAWASVTCVATLDEVEGVWGTDSLGGSSYASGKAFLRSGGYGPGMRREAFQDLLRAIRRLVEYHETKAREILEAFTK